MSSIGVRVSKSRELHGALSALQAMVASPGRTTSTGYFGRCDLASDSAGGFGQRLRAARRHAIDRDTYLASFVCEVVLDARAREDHDADRHAVQHHVVALEGRGLGVLGPVRLECDLRHLAIGGPGGSDTLGALG